MTKIREYPIIHDTIAGAVTQDQAECLKLGHDRYEKLRRLTIRQFEDLCVENLKTGVPFDTLVDRMPGKVD